MALAFQQFPLLASGLMQYALRSKVASPFSLGSFERLESPSNRLPVDAELAGEVCLVLASPNTAAYPLDIAVREFGCGSHLESLLRWDISRDISRWSQESREMTRNACEQAKKVSALSQIGGALNPGVARVLPRPEPSSDASPAT